MRILLFIGFFWLLSCNVNKKQDTQRTLALLTQSFTAKDELQFQYQFPKKFSELSNYFGWNTTSNKPYKLYEEANTYIDYWFELLQKNNNPNLENQLIDLCENGFWQADGINYFQDKVLVYIKENNKYNLINTLEDEKAKSVLTFLFDGQNPKIDKDFLSHLNQSKQQLFKELFKLNSSNFELPIHGKLPLEKVEKYYYEIEETAVNLGAVSSKKLDILTDNKQIYVSLLHNIVGTSDQMILCTHNNKLKLLSHYPLGISAQFDNGKSQTIQYEIINDSEIEVNTFFWEQVEDGVEAVDKQTFRFKIKKDGTIIKIENDKPLEPISLYLNNDAYFITDIDVNKDGIKDKIISSKPYQGDDLLVFIKEKTTYKLVLKTINFSEDGGNQIKEIKPWKKGFYVTTYFPDGGYYEEEHYVNYQKNTWLLNSTIYKTSTKTLDSSSIYVCEVAQYIDLNDKNQLKNFNTIPDEGGARKSACFIQTITEKDGSSSKKNKETAIEVYIADSSGSPTNIRDKPNGKVLFTLPSDQYFILTLKKATSGWFNIHKIVNADNGEIIEPEDNNCWIHGSVLEAGTRKHVAIRSTKETGEIVAFLEVEKQVRLKDISGNWVQVKYENTEGWVHNKWLCGNPYTTCP